MNIFTIDNIGSLTGTIVYDVSIQGYDNVWTPIYEGRVYILPGQTSVSIDLGDILWNHKFDGTGFVEPKYNTEGDNYVMCDVVPNLPNPWHNKVKVVLGGLFTVEKWVDFYNYNMFINNRVSTPILSTYEPPIFMNYQPVAHVPVELPVGITYRQLVFNGSFTKGVDNTTTVVQQNGLGAIEYLNGRSEYSLNGEVIARIDTCPKPYYLVWLTNTGTMQMQGFLKTSEPSVVYENNRRVDMSNFEWSFNKSVRGEWKLKSGLLSEKDYSAYGEMFNSPYIVLLDMENMKMHYCNIKDTTYNKKVKSPGNRVLSFEVTVQTAEIKTI